VVSIISAFQAFDQVYVLTRGGPANATTMMTYEVYKNAFATFQMGLACAKSVVLFVFLFGLTLLNRKLTGGARMSERAAGSRNRLTPRMRVAPTCCSCSPHWPWSRRSSGWR